MGVHDWSKVDAGVFHNFHLLWTAELTKALKKRVPIDYYVMAEQRTPDYEPDILALMYRTPPVSSGSDAGGVLLQTPPKTRTRMLSDRDYYSRRKRTVTLRHVTDDRLVAIIELVSPGNKSSETELETFVEKTCEFLNLGVHVLIVDLFPPTARDPEGIHGAIWDRIDGTAYAHPDDKPLTLVSYEAGIGNTTAHVEPLAVGDRLIAMPLFLLENGHVEVPLEDTYRESWEGMPDHLMLQYGVV